MPEFTGVAHVELSVRDMRRSAEWYEKVLGLRRLGEFPDWYTPGVAAHVEHMMHRPTGMTIGLMQHEQIEGGEFSEFRIGLDHLALTVGSREELGTWVDHLDACCVGNSGIQNMPYGAVVVFRDPDNIQLELFLFDPI